MRRGGIKSIAVVLNDKTHVLAFTTHVDLNFLGFCMCGNITQRFLRNAVETKRYRLGEFLWQCSRAVLDGYRGTFLERPALRLERRRQPKDIEHRRVQPSCEFVRAFP